MAVHLPVSVSELGATARAALTADERRAELAARRRDAVVVPAAGEREALRC